MSRVKREGKREATAVARERKSEIAGSECSRFKVPPGHSYIGAQRRAAFQFASFSPLDTRNFSNKCPLTPPPRRPAAAGASEIARESRFHSGRMPGRMGPESSRGSRDFSERYSLLLHVSTCTELHRRAEAALSGIPKPGNSPKGGGRNSFDSSEAPPRATRSRSLRPPSPLSFTSSSSSSRARATKRSPYIRVWLGWGGGEATFFEHLELKCAAHFHEAVQQYRNLSCTTEW